jgi:hypothetical protein
LEVPIARDLVEGDVQSFLVLRFEVYGHNLDPLIPPLDKDFQALMTTHEVAGLSVPDQRLDQVVFPDNLLELVVFRVARLQILPRVVCRRLDLGNCDFDNFHG